MEQFVWHGEVVVACVGLGFSLCFVCKFFVFQI